MLPWLLCSLILNRDVGLWRHFSDLNRLGRRCLLLRSKRTSRLRVRTSEFDPQQTSRMDAPIHY
jgi:hypothetical protein